MLLLVALACQTPFGTDRHALVGDRVAAIAVSREADEVRARAALVSDGALWSDDPVDLRWYALTDGASIASVDAAAIPDAEGPAPTLLAGLPAIGLIATFPDGAERRAFFEVPAADTSLAIASIGLQVVDRPAIADVVAVDLAARLTWTAAPADAVPVGSFARLVADTGGTDAFLRWMGRDGGQFFELDAASTDWAAGHLVFDDEEIVDRSERAAGVEGILALALGADGATAFRAVDVIVGDVPIGVRVGDRFVPTDAAVTGALVAGVLVAADDVPAGLMLADAVAVGVNDLPDADPYGTAALGCVDVSGPFHPDWLLDGRCTRAAVVGARVVMSTR